MSRDAIRKRTGVRFCCSGGLSGYPFAGDVDVFDGGSGVRHPQRRPCKLFAEYLSCERVSVECLLAPIMQMVA